jgi:hypothetical protein
MTVIPFPSRLELSSVAPPAVATDALADLVFSELQSREAELVAEADAAAEAGVPGQKESELAVVRAPASIDLFTKRSNAALASALTPGAHRRNP